MSDIYSDDFPSGRAGAPLAISPAFTRAAAAGLFLLLVIGMAFWAYRLGTRDAAEVPIIRAMEGPARIEPANPGGEIAPHQGLEVNSVLAGEPAPVPAQEDAHRIAPPTVGLEAEDGPQGELIAATPQIPVFQIPDAGSDLRMPRSDEAVNGAIADGSEAMPDAAAEVAAMIEAALRGGAVAEAEAEAGPAAAGPRPLSRPRGLAAQRPATPQPAAAPPAPSAAPVVQGTASIRAERSPALPAISREVASVAPGARLVQLGAFDSESLARQVWGDLTARNSDLLGTKSLFLERATHNARVFYRLRVTGFASSEETRILCEQLRARGVDCIPAQMN